MPASKSNNSSDANMVVAGRDALVQQLLDSIAAARRDICLLSFNLDPRTYNREDVAEAFKTFLLQSPRQRLRILLQDTSVCARGHRLIDLGRALSSFVEFKTLAEPQREIQTDWLIIDEQQVIERKTPDSLEAQLHSNNAPLARTRRRQFDNWWHAGETASALRSLHWG